MTDPYTFEDWSGDQLRIVPDADDIRLVIAPCPADSDELSVDIPVGEVRKVTAAMHEQAGLPDRWADLRAWLDDAIREAANDHRQWEGFQPGTARAARSETLGLVRARMEEIEAGQ